MVERRKTKAIAVKRWKARKEISSYNKEIENYESDTRDKIDPDQASNDKNPLQLSENGI